ncbi:LOW QUALITY PROTEIN: cytochrome P450 86B1-like [Phalaenopsis equestris]|uniref:LOW QUALITY PROTEIN: cytochrome P450 86B1-like n=1 Tax=Phalaenopsis equestris TaxID=78828 RepID=UPI0009E560CD|nr:LOW QUALITY PROTEIN: cytochrome P450 86B1-like [Phalaenopsis equestris]
MASLNQRLIFPETIHAVELILAVSIFITIHSLRQRRRQGLPSFPLLGMLPSLLLALRRNVYEWITTIVIERGGTFVFRGPPFTNLQCVVTADPRNLEHLLKEKFSSFPKGPYFRAVVGDLLGDGIFAAGDEAWRGGGKRKTASLEFHSAEFRALTARSLVELVHDRLVPGAKIQFNNNNISFKKIIYHHLHLQDILLRLTFDNVCMIAFGIDPGCLRPGLPEIPFAAAFEDATEATLLRFVTPTTIWKAMKFLDIGNERKLRRSIEIVDEFAYKVIKDRKEELKAPTATINSDLLTVFTKAKDEEGGVKYTDEFLRDVCVNFILAGRDTSSVALAWFFWLLERYRDVEEKILEELRGILKEREGEECGGGGLGGEVIFQPEDVKKMEYLHAAISEALRLYPSVPVDHKEVIEDEVFPDGTVLKKGTKLIYAIYSMGRMESIWGKDCREYKPERWLKDGRYVSESAYKFSAFNGGPRLCLGKDFAYYQMKFVAANVLRRYHISVVEGHPVAPKMALTMYMKYGLKVTLRRREGW